MQNRFVRTFYAIFQIGFVLASYLWYRWITYYFLGKGNRRAALRRLHARSAARLFRTFANLRGAYIKLAQFLSTQAILPPAYLIEFAKMQDQVRPVPFALIEEALAKDWGPDWRSKLKSIDPEPLAAASIAQVHRAVLVDGREVVVKVQYPEIKKFFSKDLALVRAMLPKYLRAIELSFKELRSDIDHDAMLGELFNYINLELDFRNELVNQKKMAKQYATWKTVVVPALVEELCTDHVICMDYIEGLKIIPWFDGATQDDRDMLFETFIDSALYGMVVKGCFQGDPHPGNFLVTPDKRLVILDFGCIKELKPQFRKGTIKLVQAYINHDTRAAAEILFGLGFRTIKGTVDSLEEWVKYGYALTDLVLEHFRQGHDLVGHMNKNVEKLAEEFMEINREHAMAKVPEEYMLVGRALATSPVPLDIYRPQFDILPLAIEHLAEASLED